VSVSAIEKYPEVPCGEGVSASQAVSAWPKQPHRGFPWNELVQKNGVPHIDNDSGGDSINLPFLRGLLSPGSSPPGRAPLGGARGVSKHAFWLLVPFAWHFQYGFSAQKELDSNQPVL